MARGPPSFMVLLAAIALFIWYVAYTADHHEDNLPGLHLQTLPKSQSNTLVDTSAPEFPSEIQHGNVIMPKLGNETAKAELGRAAWKLFHTMMARFPDAPSQDESDALRSYIHLFARLYPCGECAEHFQQILKKYPPQTSSRSTAAAWACFVHNEVNLSKGKPVFDCGNIGDFYDCGCADDEQKTKSAQTSKETARQLEKEPFEIAVEGPTRGG